MRNRLLGCLVLGYFKPSGSGSRTKRLTRCSRQAACCEKGVVGRVRSRPIKFESSARPAQETSRPKAVWKSILPAPPEQVLLTRLVELSGAQSPAPRGAFCCGL